MDFYQEMQTIASDILSEFRQGVCTLTRTSAGYVSPSEPWVRSDGVDTVYTLDATVKGISQQFVDATVIKATDLEVTASVFGVEPAAGDVLAIDGKAVTVLRTIRVPSAGTAVAYKFLVRV